MSVFVPFKYIPTLDGTKDSFLCKIKNYETVSN